MTQRAASYARASHDPRYKGTSVADQEVEIARTCEERDWEVVARYRDLNRSASRHARRERGEFEAMVSLIQAGGCDVVVAWECSRLQRDLEVYVRLRRICADAGVLWCYNGVVYDLTRRADRFRTGLDALIAEDEADATRDRVLRTTRLSADRGDVHGQIPYGHAREYDPRTGDLIGQIPHPVHAEIVREAARRFAKGEPALSIARDLNARGVPAPKGGAWGISQVTRIVSNPAHVAKRVHQGRIVGDASWAPILDEVTWQACRRILYDPARKSAHDYAVKHLLTGIALCALCSTPLRTGKPRGRVSYVCPGKFCVACAPLPLEEFVAGLIVARLSRSDVHELLPGPRTAEADTAAAEADELQAELDEATRLVGARRLTVTRLAALEADLLPRIDAARRRAVRHAPLPLLEEAIGADDVGAVWESWLIPQRRLAVAHLLDVRVGRTRQGARTFDPGRVQTDWRT